MMSSRMESPGLPLPFDRGLRLRDSSNIKALGESCGPAAMLKLNFAPPSARFCQERDDCRKASEKEIMLYRVTPKQISSAKDKRRGSNVVHGIKGKAHSMYLFSAAKHTAQHM